LFEIDIDDTPFGSLESTDSIDCGSERFHISTAVFQCGICRLDATASWDACQQDCNIGSCSESSNPEKFA
jgi:hypothetical protein